MKEGGQALTVDWHLPNIIVILYSCLVDRDEQR